MPGKAKVPVPQGPCPVAQRKHNRNTVFLAVGDYPNI
jgi:hypothetical protein